MGHEGEKYKLSGQKKANKSLGNASVVYTDMD